MSTTVQLEVKDDHIALITLQRPEAANAFSHQLMDDLHLVVEELEKKDDIRCVIITGSGDKAFCAGADLKERATMNQQQVVQAVHRIGETVNLMENVPVPVIAAINGAAFGGGLELALGCDIRYASETAKMGLTETSLGIIPGAGGTQRLPRLIGLGRAKELIFSARRVNADEAYDIGLVEKVVPQELLLEEVMQLAERIAANAPLSLKQAKTAIQKGQDVGLTTGLDMEWMCYQVTIPTEDRLEGLQAFKEKRKPIYQGK
ncbi:enoyl-CoA hydratase [Pontibacillus salicampi]|uniref:Enoyl-CoA hydratase n=1 Tax=Pontibacillus salicampi TaxID=1449801 RepID=A0ABV6LRD0_9BACI